MHRDQRGDDAVQDPLGRVTAIGQLHRWRRHQMADIAHEQQTTPRQGQGAAIQRGILPVGRQAAGEALAALDEGLLQIALHQPQPIGIGRGLVLGIDSGDRVLQIDDGGQRRFQHHIGNPGRVGGADGVRGVDHHLDMQPMMAQQQVRAVTRHQLRGVRQRRLAALKLRPRARGQRHGAVQKRLGPRDHRAATRRVIAAQFGRRRIQRIGAVQRIIQAAPTRIRRVQHKARVQNRHHQLRPCQRGNLGIDVWRRDGEGGGFWRQIADLAQKRLIFRRIAHPMRLMPAVDPGLQGIALMQQSGVFAREPREHIRRARPESLRRNAGARQHAVLDKARERRRDLQIGAGQHVGHVGFLGAMSLANSGAGCG